MLARPTLKKAADPNASALSKATQARAAEERFVLKVNGQAKRSFIDREPAVRLGAEIKKKFPLVVVTVLDSEEGTS